MSTCLIVMNREGVAVAADSAVSVGSINVVNTADKIFQLKSIPRAVVVTAASAEYMGLPVKTVFQLFDHYLLNKKIVVSSMAKLNEEFIVFLEAYSFPKEESMRFIRRQMRYYYHEVFTEGFSLEVLKENQDSLSKPDDPKFFKKLYKAIKKDYNNVARELVEEYELELEPSIQSELEEWLIRFFCSQIDFDNGVSVVFAGYGQNSLMPSMYKMYLYGQFGLFVIYEEINEESISTDNQISITTMAQDQMIDLMQDGIIISQLRAKIKSRFPEMMDYFKTDPGDSPLKDRDFLSFLEENASKIHRHIEREAIELTQHNWRPLYRGLKIQTIESLADYVEVLVSVSILSSNYNQDGEFFQTVGGPIDVATVTLVEGFQWVKYKGHYGKI